MAPENESTVARIMSHVLTLIGNTSTELTQDHVDAVTRVLQTAGSPEWLMPGHACDLPLSAEEPPAVEAARSALNGATIDIVSQPLAHRRKKLLVADMDSTIIEQECIDELADALGIRDAISEITERAMRGELDFEPALRERVGLLKGLAESELQRVYETQITETPGGRMLCATMAAHGGTCALVSGGFTFFTERVAKSVGFTSNQANTLLVENGALTGEVSDPILGREAKVSALKSLTADLKIDQLETMAVGDGANDLGMIGEAGLGVAFRAKPIVAAAAPAEINHGDLSALLYIQGYRSDEIVNPA
ncbi:phosphoserine phosphatase SerB [Parvibaculaceae bacterium PLY_AMNH_Bact1]|nr:phosphoserine phosphatase SerB [Parvibaculaceae bacterium PLY_AMNH_Bact1]